MSWAKLDSSFWHAPAGNAGAGIYARLLSYYAKYSLDRPSHAIADVIAGRDRAALRGLISAGALSDDGHGCYLLDPPPVLRADTPPRRPREARAKGYATREQVQARVDFYGGLCRICRTAPYEAMDHVKPIAWGGSKWPANLRPACTSCNSRKGAQWPFEVTHGT